MKTTKSMLLIMGLGLLLGTACNPFGSKPRPGPIDPVDSAPEATTPEIWIDNLNRAFNDRDKDLYEILIDENFWFTETNCLGEVVFENGREEELAIMGARDGTKGLLDLFRNFEYEFSLIERKIELGSEYPDAFPNDPDGHPDEDWVVFRGRVNMLMTDENNDGFRVDQIMTFKLRKDSDGLYKIARWIDDPLSGGGECGSTGEGEQSKLVAGRASWGAVKSQAR